MNIEHVNVKIFALQPFDGDVAGAIPVFHRWIQNHSRPELLIDVADYRHVPNGPGVLLIGNEADYSLDNTGGRWGLLYNRKKAEEGPASEKLERAYRSALEASRSFESAPEFSGRLKFDPFDCEFIFNDRLLVPNTPESFDAVRAELEGLAAALWPEADLESEHVGESRDRLCIRVGRRASILQPM